MIEENEYTVKIQGLGEELRVAREKIVKLEERAQREEKNASAAHERMMILEEKCRELVRILKERKAENNALMIANREYLSATPTSTNLEIIQETQSSRFDEIQKANLMVLKAKEAQYSSSLHIKVKYEKKLLLIQ